MSKVQHRIKRSRKSERRMLVINSKNKPSYQTEPKKYDEENTNRPSLAMTSFFSKPSRSSSEMLLLPDGSDPIFNRSEYAELRYLGPEFVRIKFGRLGLNLPDELSLMMDNNELLFGTILSPVKSELFEYSLDTAALNIWSYLVGKGLVKNQGEPLKIDQQKIDKNIYYVVSRGLKPGIYKTWGECKKQIRWYFKPQYKSFKSRKAAERYLKKIQVYRQ